MHSRPLSSSSKPNTPGRSAARPMPRPLLLQPPHSLSSGAFLGDRSNLRGIQFPADFSLGSLKSMDHRGEINTVEIVYLINCLVFSVNFILKGLLGWEENAAG